MAAGDVVDERTDRRGWRRRRERLTQNLGRRQPSDDEADRRALDIALAAGNLSGEADLRPCFQPQALIEQARRIEESVVVQAAEPREFRLPEARDHAQDARLLAVFE